MSEWIRAKDQEPEFGRRVLVSTDKGLVVIEWIMPPNRLGYTFVSDDPLIKMGM